MCYWKRPSSIFNPSYYKGESTSAWLEYMWWLLSQWVGPTDYISSVRVLLYRLISRDYVILFPHNANAYSIQLVLIYELICYDKYK